MTFAHILHCENKDRDGATRIPIIEITLCINFIYNSNLFIQTGYTNTGSN